MSTERDATETSAEDPTPVDGDRPAGAGERDRDEQSDRGELVSRLQLIEDQPLADRAAAFGQLHEELRSTLEAGDGLRSER